MTNHRQAKATPSPNRTPPAPTTAEEKSGRAAEALPPKNRAEERAKAEEGTRQRVPAEAPRDDEKDANASQVQRVLLTPTATHVKGWPVRRMGETSDRDGAPTDKQSTKRRREDGKGLLKPS